MPLQVRVYGKTAGVSTIVYGVIFGVLAIVGISSNFAFWCWLPLGAASLFMIVRGIEMFQRSKGWTERDQ